MTERWIAALNRKHCIVLDCSFDHTVYLSEGQERRKELNLWYQATGMLISFTMFCVNEIRLQNRRMCQTGKEKRTTYDNSGLINEKRAEEL